MLKNVGIMSILLLLGVLTIGCGGAKPVAQKAVYKSVTKFYLDETIPLDKYINENIQNECNLNTRLVSSVTSVAKSNGMEVLKGSKAEAGENLLKLKVLNAMSSGNAFIGHRKFVIVGGELYEGSKKIAEFKVARHSGGGAFGGFKSSCAVLGGCTSTIAKDIVRWLKRPTANAVLGDRSLLKSYNK